jgi:hypothetical protein
MTLYIVSSRYGTDMDTPEVFRTRKEAEESVKESICSLIRDEYGDELEDMHIADNDFDAILKWASNEDDIVSEYNDTGFPDTYTRGDDWSEWKITEVEI